MDFVTISCETCVGAELVAMIVRRYFLMQPLKVVGIGVGAGVGVEVGAGVGGVGVDVGYGVGGVGLGVGYGVGGVGLGVGLGVGFGVGQASWNAVLWASE